MHTPISFIHRSALTTLAILCLLGFTACASDNASLPVESGMGPEPTLPEPEDRWIPTVNVAKASPWQDGAMPEAAEGLRVNAFAQGLSHPRWLYVLPNGDVLVAETNAQARPPQRLMDRIRHWVMSRAGATTPSADRITLLRDADQDGVAETQSVMADDLTSPFGMALVGDRLYIANTDAVVSFAYELGQTSLSGEPEVLAPLPAGERNHHWTKGLVASPDGEALFVSVGSNSDHGENGMAAEENRAAILKIDIATGEREVLASGLRNPVGMAFEPGTERLWTVVNERDELGGDLVPDYLTSVEPGGFYGWPYSYYGDNIDERVEPPRPDLVSQAIVPDFALGAHTASLGLTFAEGASLGAAFSDGVFVGQHGSWNRKPRSGYKVIYVPWADGGPVMPPQDVLSGFIGDDDEARGRPVGVVIDTQGALLVADDVGNVVWRVSKP